MPYITSVEQIGYDRGEVEGKEKERQAIALNMLKNNLPLETIARFSTLISKLQITIQSFHESNTCAAVSFNSGNNRETIVSSS